MSKASEKNTRIKRKYLVWLKDAKGLSTASVDLAAAAIDRWLVSTKGADLAAFHVEKVRAFKRSLDVAKNEKTGRPLSAGTIDGTLRAMKAFFSWLADQPGYKSKLSHSEVAYFTPSRRIAKAAHGGRWVAHPSPEQVLHVLRQMPENNVIQRRDRAILAFLYLTGARDGALVTLRLRNIDTAAGCVHFDGPEVRTKFGKAFTTTFFPVGDEPVRIVEAWVRELREALLFGPGDPLFPKQEIKLGDDGVFEAKRLDRAPWSNADKVRAICKTAFIAAGLQPFTPHLLRRTIVDLANEHCRTPEQLKAWSQNLGHETVEVTLGSYGAVSVCRQREVLASMRDDKSAFRVIED